MKVENLNAVSDFSFLRPFQGFNPRGKRACQVDEQSSDSDIPAITCPVTVGGESLPEGSTSRRQSLFVPQKDSEESDEGSSLDKVGIPGAA